jgi:hypothetical protein
MRYPQPKTLRLDAFDTPDETLHAPLAGAIHGTRV